MKTSDIVLTTNVKLRNRVVKPTMQATFKSNPGTALCFLYCGSVTPEEDPVLRAKRVLEWMGWVLPPAEGDDEGIAAAMTTGKAS
jgi:hypothetical protein